MIHSGEKPFVCNFPGCNKQYSRSGRLKIHQRTHTGEKPYICSFKGCSKKFTEKGNLKTHMRIHSGEKPYYCDFEGCNKTFTTQGHLTDHKRRHSGDRPFKCESCSRTFMRSSTLKKHQAKHKVSSLLNWFYLPSIRLHIKFLYNNVTSLFTNLCTFSLLNPGLSVRKQCKSGAHIINYSLLVHWLKSKVLDLALTPEFRGIVPITPKMTPHTCARTLIASH